VLFLVNKADYIEYWKLTAEKDWVAAIHLFDKGHYIHSLFFAHLVIEKLLKAHWVKDNEPDVPPKSHNLLFLSAQTTLLPPSDLLRLFSQINQFQLDGRYPDYKMNMYKIADQAYTKSLLTDIEKAMLWLLSSL
jgi:HEPN domain-containing protein